MRILAFDQATNSGYAFGTEDDFRDGKSTAEFGRFKTPKRPALGEKLAIFGRGIIERAEFYKPDLIVYEEPYWPPPPMQAGVNNLAERIRLCMADPTRLRQLLSDVQEADEKMKRRTPIAAETLQFLQMVKGILIDRSAQLGIPVEGYRSSTWRKSALGDGRPDDPKKAMLRKARAWGLDVETEDEADAIGILYHALHGKAAMERAQGDLMLAGRARL